MTSMARPMPKNPPIAMVSPVRISRAASRAVTIFPVLPDRAVGTIATLIYISLIAVARPILMKLHARFGTPRYKVRHRIECCLGSAMQHLLVRFVKRSIHEAGEHA